MRLSLRLRLRTMIVTVAVAALLLAYIGSYYRLSRRGLREGVPYGIDGFLYVPVEEWLQSPDRVMVLHYRLRIFYAPVNFIDRQIFRKNFPANCFLRLSG
jgi:hypothetical protein